MKTENVRSNSAHEDSSPYEFTKTGLIGEQRDTMLSNALQILPQLGKPVRRGHKLPPQNFTYGITIPRRDGGVAEAMYHGSALDKNGSSNPDFEYVRDYSALNKAALEAGMITAKDQSRFRTVHDIKKKVFIRDVSQKKAVRFPDDMIFGIPCRPSTPISEVIEHRFLDKWIESMREKELQTKKKSRRCSECIQRQLSYKSQSITSSKNSR